MASPALAVPFRFGDVTLVTDGAVVSMTMFLFDAIEPVEIENLS